MNAKHANKSGSVFVLTLARLKQKSICVHSRLFAAKAFDFNKAAFIFYHLLKNFTANERKTRQ
ncbi:hypothetical protein MNBD_GAMMA08-977 [hydrothermal vent metagenome]|uniref:Uncharacterized protein n=1 Tax=hydrothermal vent metagenome TaxID=652676 RepID=A0A3B0YCX0_9ZZZZ